MWPSALSGRLPIVALVGRYPANWLIGRGPISHHRSFSHCTMQYRALMRYYQPFPAAIPQCEAGCPRVTHPSATQSSLHFDRDLRFGVFVRLACVRHAASVHPEPGSNSRNKSLIRQRNTSFCFINRIECFSDFPNGIIFRNFRVALLFVCQGASIDFSLKP